MSMLSNIRRVGLLSVSALALAPAIAFAQTADAAAVAEADVAADEEIIVTGTSRARAALDTPLAVTAVDDDRLAKLTSNSQADILNSVPTIKADGGGGEVATNVFVKGLPSGGQYQFTPLMYDGIPVLSSFGLNSSAYDVYYRNDLGIERLEFVRGGVSNLFGPGSVAGLINYISKTGTDELDGTIQLEAAEKDRYRGDVAISGPLGENLYGAFSAFYRSDKGPIRTGLDTEGYQLRGNLKYEFADGSGSIKLYGQYIDDKVQFYLPIPLDGTTRNRVAGNDGRKVFSVQTDAVSNLGFQTPDGPFTTDIEDGVETQGGQLALVFDKDFGDGWGINGRMKYSDYDHKFGLSSDGDGLVNVPETLTSFLANAQMTNAAGAPTGRGATIPELRGRTLANAAFTFDGGGAVPANALLFANRFTDRDRPAEDFTAELNLTKEFATGSAEHTITLGGFYADAQASDINVTTTYLAEFNNRPRLVNLTVTNPATGAQTIVSRGGLLDAGNGYVNNEHGVQRYAAYIADQIDAGRFIFDLGFRFEKFDGDIRRERTATFNTDATTPNLSGALRNVTWGNDTFLTANVDTDEWAVAGGALYKVTDDLNIYANASRGYFFPEIRAVQFSGAGVPASYSAEIIKQAEAGIKYSSGRFSGTLAGLYTKLDNRRQVLFVNDGAGGFTERVNLVATESYGVEATVSLGLTDALRFDGNLTLQDHKYTEFQALVNNVPTSNPAIVGNELERQPNFLYNAGLYYDDGAIDASLFTNYTGDNFVANNNVVELEGFNVVNFDAGYKLAVGGDRTLRVGVNVFNVFDTDATTEGSPRQDGNQTTGGAFFVGRPVLPRRVTVRATFNF